MSIERSKQLFKAVDDFAAMHYAWKDDPNTPHVTVDYWQSLDRLVAVFENGDLPANCRELAAAVYNLAKEQVKHALHGGSQDPSQDFWYAREELERVGARSRSPVYKRRIESVAQLHKENVPLEQIGRMWGMTRPDGSGDIGMVQQEIDEPGSVIGPNHVLPGDEEISSNIQSVREEYHTLSAQVQEHHAREEEENEEPVCHETSHELWSQEVPLQQAARMLKRDEADVAEEWKTFQEAKQAKQEARESKGKPKAAKSAKQPVPIEQPKVAEATTDEPRDPPVDDNGDDEEAEEPAEGDEEDLYAEFSEWSDKDVKDRAKELKIKVGKLSRESLLDKILEAEAQGVELTEANE